MIKPDLLKKNDTIALVCPGDRPLNNSSILRIKSIIESLGFNVLLGKSVFNYNGHLAGTDLERAQDINDFYINTSVRAIFCISGGYGSLKLLPLLDYSIINNNPKLLIGGQENLAMLLAINKMTSQIVFSAKNLIQIDNIAGFENLFNQLTKPNIHKKILLFENHYNSKVFSYNINSDRNVEKISGICYGTHLSSLVSLIGTKYCPNYNDSILLLDDYCEKSDTLDRHFSQLYYSGTLKSSKALVFGMFEKCYNNMIPNQFSIEDLFAYYINDVKLPAYFNVDFSDLLPIGAQCELDLHKLEIKFMDKYYND